MLKKILFVLFVVISVEAKFIRYDSNKIVLDTSTSLMWQDSSFVSKSWKEAIQYCEDLDYANKKNWKLPNVNELFSIVDLTHANQALYSEFKGEVATEDSISSQLSKDKFWTSTNIPTSDEKVEKAYYINFALGTIENDMKIENKINVRCVYNIFED